MLVLSRKSFQSIQIGQEIRITVLKMDRGQVRLGIEAPARIEVLREELTGDCQAREVRTASTDGVVNLATI